jgi:hypothetical protein
LSARIGLAASLSAFQLLFALASWKPSGFKPGGVLTRREAPC